MNARNAIPGDFIHDPTFETQRHIARYLVGTMLNELRGRRSHATSRQKWPSREELCDQIEAVAREWGVIAPPDGLKHAPMCPANNWNGAIVPIQPCNCGTVDDGTR